MNYKYIFGRDEDAFNKNRLKTRASNELVGIAKGLIADGKLNEQEVDFLCSWLSNNTEYYHTFPYNILFDRIEVMLSDNMIDEDERKELFELLTELTGEKKVKEEFEDFATTLPLTKPCPEIIIPDHTFCLTGTFLSGQRKDCEQAIFERGGIIQSSVTLALDYLVIGSKPTKDWKHSSFGNKILKAADYNSEKKAKIKIICENDWIEAMKNAEVVYSADIIKENNIKKKRTPKDPLEGMILE